ncbi:unnamed protein product [Rangifer tarandus platyrhynchus]|uniref:Uncharacterized protein n=1 Tax=Rangifer tarandus platyrhynchus TaxID=3082113 RepID=A0AC59Y905_RANTA
MPLGRLMEDEVNRELKEVISPVSHVILCHVCKPLTMILRAQLQKTKELLAPPLPENKLPSCTDFVLVAADLSGTLQRSDTALEPANKRHNQCTTAITGATVSASPSLLSCPR